MIYRSLLCILATLATGFLHGQDYNIKATSQTTRQELAVDGPSPVCLNIGDVAAGQAYEVYIHRDREVSRYQLSDYPTGAELYTPNHLTGVGRGEAVRICIENNLPGPGILDISVRKGAPTTNKMMGDLMTVADTDASSLINTLFRGRDCFDVSATSVEAGERPLPTGRASQTGTFTGGTDIIGIESGILLTTGSVTDAPLPNDLVPASGSYPLRAPVVDADARDLVGNDNYFDVAYLEFTFVPTTEFITFDYVFFSEEYCGELTSSLGNDVLGIFIDGPSGRENLALLDGATPVNAGTLNSIREPARFVNNSLPSDPDACTGDAATPERLEAIAYNGFSRRLTARAEVAPCEPHTIKILVADSGDQNLDSGVFIDASSFTRDFIDKPTTSVGGITDNFTTSEGCDVARVTFSRSFGTATDAALPLSIDYSLVAIAPGLTLAENGVDFDLPASPFIIPAGESSAVLEIPILADRDDTEGDESFIIRYEGTCTCESGTDTFTIQNIAPIEVRVDGSDLACRGERVNLTTVVTGGRGNYTFEWPDGRSGPTYDFLSDGRDNIINVTVTDECGVTGVGTYTLPAPDVTASVPDQDYYLCSGPVDVPLTVTGTSPLSVRIEVTNLIANTVEVIDTIVNEGTTLLTFTERANVAVLSVANAVGCIGATSGVAAVLTEDINSRPSVTLTDCVTKTQTLTLDLLTGNENFTFAWADDPAATGPVRPGLSPGSYEATITRLADMNCVVVETFVVDPPVALTISEITTPTQACPGDSTILSPIVIGGSPPYTFEWIDQGVTDSLLSIIPVPGETTYTLAVTDECGDTITDDITVDNASFQASVAGRYSTCNLTPPYLIPLTVTGPDDSYEVVFRELRQGSAPRIRDINVPNGTIPITFSKLGTIELISIENSAGCTGTILGDEAVLFDPVIMATGEPTDLSCADGSDGMITMDPSTSSIPVRYVWSDGGPSAAIRTGLPAGEITVRVEDSLDAACFVEETFTLTAPDPIVITGTNFTGQTCDGGGTASVSASGGTGQLTYSWSNGESGDTLFDAAAATYTVVVMDENGCSVNGSVTVPDQRTSPVATITAPRLALTCAMPSLQISAPAPSPATSYRWENSMGEDLGTTTDLEVSNAGRYFLVATDNGNGCTNRDSVTITTSDDLLTLRLPVRYDLTCAEMEVDLTVETGTTQAVTYAWSRDGVPLGDGQTLPDVASPGMYRVLVTRTDNGCPSQATTQVVTRQSAPPVSALATPVSLNCANLTVSLGVTEGPYTYAWTTDNGSISGPGNQASINTARTGTYDVRVNDPETGCDTLITLEVIVDESVVDVNAGPDRSLNCNTAQTRISATTEPPKPGTELRWFFKNSMVGEGPTLDVAEEGDYIVEAIDPDSGCNSFDTISVFSPGATAVDFFTLPVACEDIGGRLVVTNVAGFSPPYTFSSPTGRPDTTGDGLINLPPGPGVLTVTDAGGCELTETFDIAVGEDFTATAPDIEAFIGQQVTLGIETNRGDGALVQWDWVNIQDTLACRDCPNPVISRPLESFTAGVTVRDSNGCELTLRQNVVISERDFVFFPTAFSPSTSDGVNDVYTVFGDAEFVAAVNTFQVFNRWGNQVFTNDDFAVNDPNQGWDGRADGGDVLPSGVYAYVATITLYDGSTEVYHGSFTLVR